MKVSPCIFLVLLSLPLLLIGCGSGTAISNASPGSIAGSNAGSSGSSGAPGSNDAPGASTPGKTVVSNVQTLSGNWRSWGQASPDYVDCSAPCSQSSWEEIYGVADPSISGNATMFDLDPKIPYADALFAAGLIGQDSPQIPDADHTILPSLHNFIYDTYFYVVTPEITQSLEFDVNMFMNGVGMIWGHQCNHLGDGDWDIWDNANSRWVSAGIPCQFVSGWNHLTIQVQREPDNSLLYQSIALNGSAYTLNKISPAGTASGSWWGLTANFQMDSNKDGAPNTVYLDNFTVTSW